MRNKGSSILATPSRSVIRWIRKRQCPPSSPIMNKYVLRHEHTPVFIFTLCNTGIPLSLNFLGEQLSLIGIWDKSPVISALGATGIVFSACYSIYLYNRISYGLYSPHLKPYMDITRHEFNLLIALLIPTVLLGILPNVVLQSIHLPVSSLLYY